MPWRNAEHYNHWRQVVDTGIHRMLVAAFMRCTSGSQDKTRKCNGASSGEVGLAARLTLLLNALQHIE